MAVCTVTADPLLWPEASGVRPSVVLHPPRGVGHVHHHPDGAHLLSFDGVADLAHEPVSLILIANYISQIY